MIRELSDELGCLGVLVILLIVSGLYLEFGR